MVDPIRSGTATKQAAHAHLDPRHIDRDKLLGALGSADRNRRVSAKPVHAEGGGVAIHLSSRGEGHPLRAAWHKLTSDRQQQNRMAATFLHGAIAQARKSIVLGSRHASPEATNALDTANRLEVLLKVRMKSGRRVEIREVHDSLVQVLEEAKKADEGPLAAVVENRILRGDIDRCFGSDRATIDSAKVNSFVDGWVNDRVAGRKTAITALADGVNRPDADMGSQIHPDNADEMFVGSAQELMHRADELLKATNNDAGLAAAMTRAFSRDRDNVIQPGALAYPVAQLVAKARLLQRDLEADTRDSSSLGSFQKRAGEMISSTRSLLNTLVRISELTRDRDLLHRVAPSHQQLLMQIGSSAVRLIQATIHRDSSMGLMLRFCQMAQDETFAANSRASMNQRLSAPQAASDAPAEPPGQSVPAAAPVRPRTNLRQRRRQAQAASRLLGKAQLAAQRFQSVDAVQVARAALARQAQRAEWRVNRAAVRLNADVIAGAALDDWQERHSTRLEAIEQVLGRVVDSGLIAKAPVDAMRGFLRGLGSPDEPGHVGMDAVEREQLAAFSQAWKDQIVNAGFLEGRGAATYKAVDEIVGIIETFQLAMPQ